MCKHCSTDLCSGYYGVHKSHLLLELWGISIGFHVSSTDTFNCPVSVFTTSGYESSLNFSTLPCCCTLSFTCQCEVPSAEENNIVLRSDPCYCRCKVRSTNGRCNAVHHKVMKSLISFIKLFHSQAKIGLIGKQNQR